MIIDEYIEPDVLTGYVREVPSPANLVLSQFLPDRNIQDIEAAIDQVTRTNRAAKFRAWDAESYIGKRDQFETRRISLPPISQKLPVGEWERLQLERVRSGGDNRAAIINRIYDDMDNNVRAIFNRMEIARGDALMDGIVSLSADGLTGIEADFGLDASHIVTPAGAMWDDAANGEPLTDLRGWVQTYVADTGERPAYMLVSEAINSALLLSEQIRHLASTLAGIPALMNQDQLNQVMAAYRLPAIFPYDTRIDFDGTTVRVVDERKAIFLPADPSSLGFTAWGITAEALELASGQNPSLEFEQTPGLIGVVMKEGDPLRVWTKAGAVGLPMLTDTRRLMVATVLAP